MRRSICVALLAALFSQVLSAPSARAADMKPGQPSFKLTRLAEKLPVGAQWATLQSGFLCTTRQKLSSDGALKPTDLTRYAPVFEREFGPMDPASRGGANLFERPELVTGADYEIGGLVHGMDLKFCYQSVSPRALLLPVPFVPSGGGVNGSARLDIQWQVYSTAKREVVATIETSGTFELRERRGGDATQVIIAGAFAENVRRLASSPELVALREAPLPAASSVVAPAAETAPRLRLAASHPAPRMPAEATGAVVLVSLPESFGSGVLVSPEGYILTNQHVVGRAKTVRVRWSDGLETEGEVLRSHKGRDVALIKTNPRDRDPLPVRSRPVEPGETVLAIGAPLEEALQGTITRGIVSAHRIVDGYAFIQSDVGVNHGNSGGPLIDEHGFVVGLTDTGLQSNGTPIGLNFFIPIKDALDFLGVDIAPPDEKTPPVQKTSSGPATSSLGGRQHHPATR